MGKAGPKHGLGQPRHEGTGVPARIQIEQKVALGLQGEGPVGESSDGPTKQGLDPISGFLPSQRIPGLFGIKLLRPPTGLILSASKSPAWKKASSESGLRKHEVKQILDLLVRDLLLPANLLPVQPDLLFHHVAQSQPAGHGLRGIFRGQDLRRKVQGPNHLQEG